MTCGLLPFLNYLRLQHIDQSDKAVLQPSKKSGSHSFVLQKNLYSPFFCIPENVKANVWVKHQEYWIL